jgi:hypothetical protein
MTVAGYTYLQLQEEVLTHQFSEQKYKPLVSRWLNQAQRQAVISSEIRLMEEAKTITTSAGVTAYALPTDYQRLIDLFYVSAHELLVPMDIRDFDALPTSEGRPYGYTVRDANLFLYPTPSEAYEFTLRYWRLPADMVADSDTPEIPVQYHQLLISYAMWKAFLREDDGQMATTWKAEWEAGLLKMRGEVQGDTFDGPRQVGGTWGDAHGIPPYTAGR